MRKESFALKLRFSGKSVNEHGLDLYDGSQSFHGFAQAIQIAIHAYMNDKVTSHATALKGAEVYFKSPRNGSVLFDLVAVIERYPITATLSAAVFYDFIKFSLSKASGLLQVKPETSSVQKLLDKDELFFDHLSETLEGSLQRARRAIDYGVEKITIERPRSSLVTFNRKTSEWVNTREENPDIETFTGNVTRYNSISKNGRAYIRELNKLLPIRPADEFPNSKKGHLTWSLHGDNVDASKELKFHAYRIASARGEAKRLILANVDTAN